MKLPELFEGVLLRRYKRFLADIELPDGSHITAHCPNTGAMTGCAEPGSPAWVSVSDNPKRKYAHTLEIVQTPQGYVSVNTGRANYLVAEALHNGKVAAIDASSQIKAEAKIPEGDGRFDFLVVAGGTHISVEVKSTTLMVGDQLGAFPDAVSSRALKHLDALARRVAAGERALLIFCAQHCGIEQVRPAAEIDAVYAQRLSEVAQLGVEVQAYGCSTDLHHMSIDRQLAVLL
jgi:sugar fermentation stimulation protein A